MKPCGNHRQVCIKDEHQRQQPLFRQRDHQRQQHEDADRRPPCHLKHEQAKPGTDGHQESRTTQGPNGRWCCARFHECSGIRLPISSQAKIDRISGSLSSSGNVSPMASLLLLDTTTTTETSAASASATPILSAMKNWTTN